jgi:acyl-coenzyme A thioesterase PaaI-like protein
MPAETAPYPALWARIADSLARQGMSQVLGVRLLRVEPGCVELVLPYSSKVTQQQRGFHGGATGMLADIAGGYAAFQDGELRATGKVMRAGKRVTVASTEVLHVDGQGRSSPCALMQQTLTTVPVGT